MVWQIRRTVAIKNLSLSSGNTESALKAESHIVQNALDKFWVTKTGQVDSVQVNFQSAVNSMNNGLYHTAHRRSTANKKRSQQ